MLTAPSISLSPNGLNLVRWSSAHIRASLIGHWHRIERSRRQFYVSKGKGGFLTSTVGGEPPGEDVIIGGVGGN